MKRTHTRKIVVNRTISPGVESEIQALAAARKNSNSWATDQLLILGIAAYKISGKLPCDFVPEDSPEPDLITPQEALRLAVKGWREELSQKEMELIRRVMEWDGKPGHLKQ